MPSVQDQGSHPSSASSRPGLSGPQCPVSAGWGQRPRAGREKTQAERVRHQTAGQVEVCLRRPLGGVRCREGIPWGGQGRAVAGSHVTAVRVSLCVPGGTRELLPEPGAGRRPGGTRAGRRLFSSLQRSVVASLPCTRPWGPRGRRGGDPTGVMGRQPWAEAQPRTSVVKPTARGCPGRRSGVPAGAGPETACRCFPVGLWEEQA